MIENVEQFWSEVRKLCEALAASGQQDWAGDLGDAFSVQPGVEQMAHARWVISKLRKTPLPETLQIVPQVAELIRFTDAIGEDHQIHWNEPPG